MTAIFILLICTLLGVGAFLTLRPRMFSVILGLILLGHAANLLILVMGRIKPAAPPILSEGPLSAGVYTDPLSQAFILTAIVIGFGVTSLLLMVAYRASHQSQSDQVDGHE